MAPDPTVTVDLLTAARAAEWLEFFEGPAFADNPDWGACYCRCLRFGAQGVEAWERACATPGENRAAMLAALAAGELDGVLARRGGALAGWLQFGPATRFVSPIGTTWGSGADEGAVVCFVVAAAHRRGGVARAMLRLACEALAARGFRSVHALATLPATGAEAEDMHQFTGPLALYVSEGFTVVGEAGARRVRVARALGG